MFGAVSLLMASGAHATVTETLSTSSTYSLYDHGSIDTGDVAGDSAHLFVDGTVPGQPTSMKLDYDSTVSPDGSFDFLHNLTCVGTCSIRVNTLVTDLITNDSDQAVTMRLDTHISAGHIGFQGNTGGDLAGFSFQVAQTDRDADGNALGTSLLYFAGGGIDAFGGEESAVPGNFNGPFAGLSSYVNGNESAYDWGETNLNMLVTIAAGGSATIVFNTQSFANSFGTCDSIGACDGVQIAFGDPRNNGGVEPNLTGRSSLFDSSGGPNGISVIGRQFDADSNYLHLVDADAPLPPPGQTFRAPLYAPGPFAAAGVPEPANWAMMILGFGMTGATMRRRTRSTHFA